MGEARKVMDLVTDAMLAKDFDTLASLYAPDALARTPELGEIRGREQIAGYFRQYMNAFPDSRYELVAAHEAGNVAIDEGYFAGENTGDLQMPDGDTIPATGRSMRLLTCDIATVENGLVVNHRFYYDQLDFLSQLGLLPQED
jgi:ketosteroid isomerase-like protein